MNDETMLILNMLDQGKIDSDEAERLLDAVNPSAYKARPRVPRMPKDFMKNIEKIPQIVSDRLADIDIESHIENIKKQAFGGGGKKRFEGADKITINQMSGDVKLCGTDRDIVLIKNKGNQQKTIRKNRSVAIQSNSGDLDIIAPAKASIAVQNMSGDIEAHKLNGKCKFNAFSGDIDISVSGGILKGNVYSGDIELTALGDFDGKVTSYSGDIELDVAEDLNMKFIFDIVSGDFENLTEYEVKKKEKKYFLTMGTGEKIAKFKVLDGDVEIRIIDELDELDTDIDIDIDLENCIDDVIDDVIDDATPRVKVKIKANLEDDGEETIIISDED